MDLREISETLEKSGFHILSINPIERGYRISIKESLCLDIIYSDIVLYYFRKINCELIDRYREIVKKNYNDVINKGYISGFYIDKNCCYLVVVKKLEMSRLDNFWNEYINIIKVADLSLKE
ncbi:hypothetical protein DFR86_01910 [Acidianus sulfidivorans JP7]|uniref:Uncharacterized protein n=1 Tax=Acidianus sulfidivorans JP7 TaxID=619593 RepID=A0A2U9IK74_9CREN|nr:hypothetical protein [Acidianus sulfidivorans]AWR96423.1 hypothetical protein DFR86_01910 [Acidianus sulfidivorans JP7]